MSKLHTGTKVFLALFRPIQRLPLGFHYFWGRCFSWLCEKLVRYRRDDVMINLARSFPGKNYWELYAIAHQFYGHLGEIFAEAIWFGGNHHRPGRCHRQKIVESVNGEELFEAFKLNPNVMLLDSHFGNWELTGAFFESFYDKYENNVPIKEDNICPVYKRLSNRFWDEFFHANRTACQSDDYDGYTESLQVMRFAVRHRNDVMLYIFPTDQFPYGNAARCDIPSFMNQPTKAMIGGASLAHKIGMPVFYQSVDRVERGRYVQTFKKICDDASKLEPAQVMERYYALLQEDIERNPSNYLWTHRRWKINL